MAARPRPRWTSLRRPTQLGSDAAGGDTLTRCRRLFVRHSNSDRNEDFTINTTTSSNIEDWIEHRREEDDELVGFLAPIGDRFIAMTVFGTPLAKPADRVDAEHLLNDSGLSYLAERWSLQIDDQSQISVEIVEASPEQVVVQNVDFGSGFDHGHRFTLQAPVGDQLVCR